MWRLTLSRGVILISVMAKELSSVDEVISELGGAEAVRALTKAKGASVVPMWKTREQFPAKTYTILKPALEERGLTAPNSLWGMP